MSLWETIENLWERHSEHKPEKESRWGGARVNDMHAQLNATYVCKIERPTSLGELQQIVRQARAEGKVVCIAGARPSAAAHSPRSFSGWQSAAMGCSGSSTP